MGVLALKKLFTLAPIFTDGMVLQAEKPIKIFGTCKKGIEIVVTFPHQEVKIKTKDEFFQVEVEPLKATKQGFSFTVSSKKQSLTIYNCLIGEVFFLVGETNIRFPLKESFHQVVKEIPYIRYYEVPRVPYMNAHEDYPKHFKFEPSWKISNQENADSFSAVGYFISTMLYENLKVPVGIVTYSEEDLSIFSLIDEKYLLSSTKLRRMIVSYQKELEKYEYEQEYFSIFEQELSYIREGGGYRTLPMGPRHFNRPGGMYHLLQNVLGNYPVKALIYYQGESDWAHEDIYDEAMKKMIDSLRSLLGDSKLPVFYTQLAAFTYPGLEKNRMAKLREAQANCMNSTDNIYMASAIDLGESDNMTPKDKAAISERLANIILEKVYKIGKNTLSPSYFSYQINKDKLVIYTQHNPLNLVSNSMQNLGFFVSTDRVNYEECRNVKIENNQILIPFNRKMKEVEYGFINNPHMDIYSSNGLPLLPFRIKIDI